MNPGVSYMLEQRQNVPPISEALPGWHTSLGIRAMRYRLGVVLHVQTSQRRASFLQAPLCNRGYFLQGVTDIVLSSLVFANQSLRTLGQSGNRCKMVANAVMEFVRNMGSFFQPGDTVPPNHRRVFVFH